MAAGFVGLLDFAGYPVGRGALRAGGKGGFRGAGRRYYIQALIASQSDRSLLDAARLRQSQQLLARMSLASKLFGLDRIHQKQMTARAAYTVLLSEL
jgi:hypothetical protein